VWMGVGTCCKDLFLICKNANFLCFVFGNEPLSVVCYIPSCCRRNENGQTHFGLGMRKALVVHA
jgi:hypothetical protein